MTGPVWQKWMDQDDSVDGGRRLVCGWMGEHMDTKRQDGDAEGGGEWCTGILLMLHFGKGLLVRSGGRFSKIQKG